MDSRKILRWASRRLNGNTKEFSDPAGNPRGQETAPGQHIISHRSGKSDTPQHSLSELPFRIQESTQFEVLIQRASARKRTRKEPRGFDQRAQDLLMIRRNECKDAATIIDPDFFDDTVDGITQTLENFSQVNSGSPSSRKMLISSQANLMLNDFGQTKMEQNAPVCQSTPKNVNTTDQGDDRFGVPLKIRLNDFETPNLDPDSEMWKCRNHSVVCTGIEWPKARRGHYPDVSKSTTPYLEGFSTTSSKLQSPIQRFNDSMTEIDKAFSTYDMDKSLSKVDDHSSLILGSRIVIGSARPSSALLIPSKVATATEMIGNNNLDQEPEEEGTEEDPFLYLAWTNMPAIQSRSKRRRRQAQHPPLLPTANSKPQALHPKIYDANNRITTFKCSPLGVQLDKDINTVNTYKKDANGSLKASDIPRKVEEARRRIAFASENGEFRDALRDFEFVNMYTAEMESRCKRGVWWEGWLIVGELERRGFGRCCSSSSSSSSSSSNSA